MKFPVTILAFLCTVLITSRIYGQTEGYIQESRYKSFRLLIISPDTAQVHDSLEFIFSSIESNFKNSYYHALKEFESKRYSPNTEEAEETELAIRQFKWHEIDVVRFRYYHMISIATLASLQESFQQYPWEKAASLECQIINKQDLETDDFVQLTNDFDFDYIVFFQDIHTVKAAGSFIMNMTTNLFSKADSKVIMKKETSKRADKYVCDIYEQNLLECMMIGVADNAGSDLFEILDQVQKR